VLRGTASAGLSVDLVGSARGLVRPAEGAAHRGGSRNRCTTVVLRGQEQSGWPELNRAWSRVEISQVNERLARDILELARSLGFKATLRDDPSTLYGRVVGRRYRVCFLANEPCCHLPRKLAQINLTKKNTRARFRYITAIESVESEPVKCIAVDAPDRSYLMTASYTVTHNTLQVSVGRTLFELGQDPSLRYLFLSHKQDVMKKVASLLMQYIESSIELHEVFPDLVPGDQEWGASAFTVRRKNKAKDPTVQLASENASPLSARIDRVLADDIITLESTSSPKARKDTIEWWPSIIGRTTARARITLLGNAFHPEDLYHHLAKLPEWVTRRYPIMVKDPTTGEFVSRWPEQWPIERVMARAKKMHPKEVKRQLMCEARDDGTAWFPQEVIELALRLGDGTELAHALAAVPRGYRTYTGVDLAIKQKDSNDTTCLFTIAVDPYGVRRLLCIERGRWPGPEIVRRIIDTHRRFQSEIWLEDNAAQDWMRQWVNATEIIPIRGFTTGRNKHHPEYGVASLATEFQTGKWHVPNHSGVVHPIVQQWIDEMLYYDPAAHTGDSLMASWIAREAARKGESRVGSAPGLDLLRR